MLPGNRSSLFAFVILSLTVLNCSAPETGNEEAYTADRSLVLKVDGMVCASGCAGFIEKKVSAITGVSSCSVSFSDGIAEVIYASESTSEEKIIREINSLNDGRYKAEVISSDRLILDRPDHEEASHGGKGANVSLRLPELVKYFMSGLVR